MKHVIFALSTAIGLSIAIPQTANAAGCPVSVTIENKAKRGFLCGTVYSKTRANARWTKGLTLVGRKNCVAAGKSKTLRLNYPIVGCAVKRAVKFEYRCVGIGSGGMRKRVKSFDYHKPKSFGIGVVCR